MGAMRSAVDAASRVLKIRSNARGGVARSQKEQSPGGAGREEKTK